MQHKNAAVWPYQRAQRSPFRQVGDKKGAAPGLIQGLANLFQPQPVGVSFDSRPAFRRADPCAKLRIIFGNGGKIDKQPTASQPSLCMVCLLTS